MLPAARHRWTCHVIIPAKQASTRFTYPGGMEGWVDSLFSTQVAALLLVEVSDLWLLLVKSCLLLPCQSRPLMPYSFSKYYDLASNFGNILGFFCTVLCDLQLRKWLRPRFQATSGRAKLYNVITFCATHVCMPYVGFPFMLLEFIPCINVYRSVTELIINNNNRFV